MAADRLTCLGFDIGGTKALAALVDAAGRVLAERREPTQSASASAFLAQVRRMADDLCAERGLAPAALDGIGVGLPGAVSPHDGRLRDIPNIAPLDGRGMTAELSAMFGRLVRVENDVNAAAYGEFRAAGGCGSLAMIAIGTGIGLGSVADGRILSGRRGAAGEIATLPAGRGQTLESRLGGAGWAEALDADPSDLRTLFDARAPHLQRIMPDNARILAALVAQIDAILAPDRLILAGSIGSQPMLIEAVNAALGDSPLRVEAGRLGAHAGTIGAAALAMTAPAPAAESR